MTLGSPGSTKIPSPDSLSLLPRVFGLSLHPNSVKSLVLNCFFVGSELLFPWFYLFSSLSSPHIRQKLWKSTNDLWFSNDFAVLSNIILVSIDQHWPTLINIDRQWPTLINIDQHWSTLVTTHGHWSTPSTLTNIDQRCPTLINIVQHWSSLMNIDWTCHPIPFHPIPSPMRASKVPQSPHRLLKAAEPLEALISSRNLTQYKKFNFASKPKFVNQVWPFNTPHPSNPPVLQSSNHPVILVWEGGMRVAIE